MTYSASTSKYWPPERIERMQVLLGEGLTSREIGERLGVSHRAVLAKCSRLGIPCGRPTQEWSEERSKQLRELVAMGLSSRQIGNELGVTRNAVLGKMHREGITPLPRNRSARQKVRNGRNRPQPNKVRLYDGWRKPRQTAALGLGYAVTDPAAHLPPGMKDLPPDTPGAANGIGLTIFDLAPDSCRYPCAGGRGQGQRGGRLQGER